MYITVTELPRIRDPIREGPRGPICKVGSAAVPLRFEGRGGNAR